MVPNSLRALLAMGLIVTPARGYFKFDYAVNEHDEDIDQDDDGDIRRAMDYADFLYGPYHLNCISDTEWVKGSGALIRTMLENIFSRFNDKDGVFAAFQRETRPTMAMEPEVPAVDADGEEHSVAWVTYGNNKHDGWLYGEFTDREALTGDDLYYLYSDYHTAIRGKFVKGKLIFGRQVRLKYFRCRDELLELHFTEPAESSPVPHYERPTETRLTLRPRLMDPIDRRNVFVDQSTLGEHTGEGLFARRSFLAGDLICLYAGAQLPNGQSWLLAANLSREAATARLKNLMNLGQMEIDVAEDDVVKFRASLGHKAQHSFKPNAKYCNIKSPRFGAHKCIEAVKDIRKYEEIFVDYDYRDLHAVNLPQWYRQLFVETFPDRADEATLYDCSVKAGNDDDDDED